MLAEERSLANPCARGDCPDCHALKSTFAQMPRSVKTAPKAVLTDRVRPPDDFDIILG